VQVEICVLFHMCDTEVLRLYLCTEMQTIIEDILYTVGTADVMDEK